MNFNKDYDYDMPTCGPSKNLVEAHGGKIWAYNNSNGRGATFCFTLPLKSVGGGLSPLR
jgi:hypothetical protein